MQVNVTISINGPSGQELSVVIWPTTARLTFTDGREDGDSASLSFTLAELRQFVAALGKVVGDA